MVEVGIKAATPPLVVKWRCRRCGQKGLARSTMFLPMGDFWKEDGVRALLDALRLKLVKIHLRADARGAFDVTTVKCFPTVEDFVVERATMEDAELVGLV